MTTDGHTNHGVAQIISEANIHATGNKCCMTQMETVITIFKIHHKPGQQWKR